MNIYKMMADIAEYNAYIIEIECSSLDDANQVIFSMSKQMSHNIKYKMLEVAVRRTDYSSPLFDNVMFNQVKRKVDDGFPKAFDIKDIDKYKSDNDSFIFCYNALVAEYNRYKVDITTINKESAINLLRLKKSDKQSDYHPSLIQVNSRPYFKGNQNIIVLS